MEDEIKPEFDAQDANRVLTEEANGQREVPLQEAEVMQPIFTDFAAI